MASRPDLRDDGEQEAEAEEARAQAEARRRIALAQIRQYPDVILRMPANDVERFDESLARLAERMTQLMHDARGVGLAATQVGVLQRLFVFVANEDEDARAMANPRLAARSTETDVADEGCLSIQNVSIPVERSVAVTLAGLDLEGQPLELELEEHAARVVQHELDHLDGTLILERTDDASRRAALAILRRQI